MLNINRLGVLLLCALVIYSVGCRSKEPVAAPASKASNTGDGPLLAPPQQQTGPAAQGDHAALPTAGDPAGTSATSTPAAAPGEATQAAQPTEGDPSGKATPGDAAKPAGGESTEAAKIKASFASLSSGDRALAEKQKICPVSGEKLGSMGAPKKISVAGREVFICCPGCEEALKNEPAKFLAKIGLEPAAEK